MSLRFTSAKYFNTTAINSSTLVVVTDAIDISHLDRFSLLYQNLNASGALLDLVAQGAYDSSATAADLPPNWFDLPTTTLTVPSALGATATVWTTAVDNTLKWIRFKSKTASSAAVRTLAITVAGFQRS